MSITSKFKIGDKVLCTQFDYESWYGFKDILTINSEPFLDLNGKDICYWVKEKPNNDMGILEDHFIRYIEIIPKLEQQYSDGDVCLYGERQVVIIGEPNKERQSAQIVDYPFAEDWQFQVETCPLGHLGMVLWNRFEEEKGDSAHEKGPANKYMREIKPGVWVDVYDVLHAFVVTNPALQHLIKKALAVGQRGHKDASEDYQDIIDSSVRAKQLHEEWND